MGTFIAHQGGWDEILLVVTPLAVIGGFLWTANKKMNEQAAKEIAAETNNTE